MPDGEINAQQLPIECRVFSLSGSKGVRVKRQRPPSVVTPWLRQLRAYSRLRSVYGQGSSSKRGWMMQQNCRCQFLL